jgi:hypothetical protein
MKSCKNSRPTFKLWAARTPHQLTAIDYTKHHAASEYSLILPQLDWQDQLQSDTRSKKAPLGPSTPAPWCDPFARNRHLWRGMGGKERTDCSLTTAT